MEIIEHQTKIFHLLQGNIIKNWINPSNMFF